MVAVAQHKVSEVTFSPLVEESGIVVLGLTSAPHIKRLIHNDKSHGVAHGEEFGCRRIMRASHCVHTHLLEYAELTV